MIDSASQYFQNGLVYIRKNPQLLLTVVLIVVIPLAFILSSQKFLSATRANQENLERERIGTFHDTFQSVVMLSWDDISLVQTEIKRLAELNTDIASFHIVAKRDQEYVIIASLHDDELGRSPYDLEPYRLSMTNPSVSFTIPKVENNTRFWESYRFVPTASDGEYIIYTKTSLSDIDALFASRIREAYVWLLGILLVVLYLVVRHVRLIDYSYLYRETKKANEMKDLFTNMIAHELRAPLTAVRGYASLIQEDVATAESTKTHAQKINQSAERLLTIVNDLLDVARLQSGKLALQPLRVDILATISGVIDAIRVSAQEKGITLSQEGVQQPLYITVDEKRFFQALTNLVSNAIKYTKAGTIAVSLEDKEGRIEIRVKDTGMGISAEHQEHLFAPFYRVENSETTSTVGTGLGMWITKQLIERMQGSIAVESIKGVGTHVVVTLPKK